MKKSEVNILYNIEKIDQNSSLLAQPPNNPQQRFMLTYAAIYFINKGLTLPVIDKLLQQRTGSSSEQLLKLKYMRQCMENRVNLDNNEFHVLNTLVLWVEELKKINKSQSLKLVDAILLPHPQQLTFEYYEEFIVYLNYLAVDIQNLFKAKSSKWEPEDLLLFLQLALPRIHFNIILPSDLFESKKQDSRDMLFCNISLEYFAKSSNNYRGICRLVLSHLITMDLKAAQMRQLIDIACRYYLLFWSDSRQKALELFVASFKKATEAVRFSLTDELLLFFKICQKLGATGLLSQLRLQWQWINGLLTKYKDAVIGHPKEEVNPYNPLSIRESFIVPAGKTEERVLQIYQDETLFYFMISVGENDINLRLYYLGDFDSKIEVKKLLHFDEKKSGENRFAYLASKRGLYLIEFDNSYSWINSKTITYEQVVLVKTDAAAYPPWLVNMYDAQNIAPTIERESLQEAKPVPKPSQPKKEQEQIQTHNLQEIYSSEQYEQGLQEQDQLEIEPRQTEAVPDALDQHINIEGASLDALEQTKVEPLPNNNEKQTKKQLILSVENVPEHKNDNQQVATLSKKQSRVHEFRGQANLSLIDSIFSLLVSTQDHTYEFETNLEDRIIKRLTVYCEAEDHYQWIVNGQAREWLRKRGFGLVAAGGANILSLSRPSSNSKRQSSKQ